MRIQTELVKLPFEHEHKLLQLLREYERKADAPAPRPAPARQPEPVPANETHVERLQRLAREDAAEGRAVSMNDMLRSIPKPNPPRRPSWSLD